MTRTCLGFCGALLLVSQLSFVAAQDDLPPPPKGQTPSRATELEDLTDLLDNAVQEIVEGLGSEATDEQRAAAQQKVNSLVDATRDKVYALAKAAPKDAVSLSAIEWLSQFQDLPADQSAAIHSWLMQYHTGSPRLMGLMQLLETGELTAEQRKFLEAVADKNAFGPMRGQALLTIARSLASDADAPALKLEQRKPLRADAKKILQRLKSEFGKIEGPDGPYGEIADSEIYTLEKLSVGNPAPAAAAVDLEGQPVNLESYRGKVVVFDAWATWCGPCVAMLPHERELVTRLKDQPFALISVSVDDDRQTVKAFQTDEPMPWTNWWVGPEGKLLQTWRIERFPTIYVLDAQGVIRFKDLRGFELDAAVDALLKEAAAAQ